MLNWLDGMQDSDVRDGTVGFTMRDGVDSFDTRDKVGNLGIGEMVLMRPLVVPFMTVAEVGASGVLAKLKRGQSDVAKPVY